MDDNEENQPTQVYEYDELMNKLGALAKGKKGESETPEDDASPKEEDVEVIEGERILVPGDVPHVEEEAPSEPEAPEQTTPPMAEEPEPADIPEYTPPPPEQPPAEQPPAPSPQPTPPPEPESVPEPEAEPASEPVPEPDPQPSPEPEPEPAPPAEPASEPQPASEPPSPPQDVEPAGDPEPEPSPEPQPQSEKKPKKAPVKMKKPSRKDEDFLDSEIEEKEAPKVKRPKVKTIERKEDEIGTINLEEIGPSKPRKKARKKKRTVPSSAPTAKPGKAPKKAVKKAKKPVKSPVKRTSKKKARAIVVPPEIDAEMERYVEMVQQASDRITDEVGKVILGKDYVLKMVMTAILSDGHILFEDFPGLAKTLMANTFARALGCRFRRVQFTPDLLPADITGTFIYDEKESDFKFREGPIFTNILLSDEINRSPPKTQAALLEAMQEYQVTLEGDTMELSRPFVVLATQNPIEYEGTYSLPEAQLDRFLMRLSVGYPSEPVERRILMNRMKRKQDDVDVEMVASPKAIVQMQQVVENIYVSEPVIEYMVSLVRRTREDPRVNVGSSPRGSLALFKLSRALAAIDGRAFVLPDDVKSVAVNALNHRIILNPEPRIMGVKPEDVIRDIITETPVPVVE